MRNDLVPQGSRQGAFYIFATSTSAVFSQESSVITSRPANESGRDRIVFALPVPSAAGLFLCANCGDAFEHMSVMQQPTEHCSDSRTVAKSLPQFPQVDWT